MLLANTVMHNAAGNLISKSNICKTIWNLIFKHILGVVNGPVLDLLVEKLEVENLVALFLFKLADEIININRSMEKIISVG